MKGIYFYKNEMIQKTPCNKGWYVLDNHITTNIYKTINDAKNAIDKMYGIIPEGRGKEILKRYDNPVKVIGKMIFVLDGFSNDGKVQSHYEYEWYD